jgi:hypothetical protein
MTVPFSAGNLNARIQKGKKSKKNQENSEEKKSWQNRFGFSSQKARGTVLKWPFKK